MLESRQFPYEDAAQVFHYAMLSADDGILQQELVRHHRWANKGIREKGLEKIFVNDGRGGSHSRLTSRARIR